MVKAIIIQTNDSFTNINIFIKIFDKKKNGR